MLAPQDTKAHFGDADVGHAHRRPVRRRVQQPVALGRAFREPIGVSPRRFSMLRRLAAVRAELLMGDFEIPTSFALDADQVDQLIATGRELLRNNAEFKRLLAGLAGPDSAAGRPPVAP